MTITQAIAANVVAKEFISQARRGVYVSGDVRDAMCSLLKGAQKALKAGFYEADFRSALAAGKRKTPKAGA